MTDSRVERMVSLDGLVERAVRLFEAHYGRTPRWVAAAPGRVNLIGEHTDYNEGFVLPMAIERYTVLAADRPVADEPAAERPAVRLVSDAVDGSVVFEVQGGDVPKGPKGDWSNYVRGVVAGFVERGVSPGALDVAVVSSVPLGGGLSSSAALEVAAATLLEAVTGASLAPLEKALLCQQAEHSYAGVPCGIMDQFTAVFGQPEHLLLIDCRTNEATPVPLSDPGVTVLIVNSNVKHELTGGEYAQRRAQCESAARVLGVRALRDATLDQLEAARDRLSEVEFRRARHVITENQRTLAAADALRRGDWSEVGRLMYASHESLRNDYEVSCDELDLLVQTAQDIGPDGGVLGSRMTGGGFGGCTVTLVRTERVAEVAERIAETYQRERGIEPTAFASRPARGAHVVRTEA